MFPSSGLMTFLRFFGRLPVTTISVPGEQLEIQAFEALDRMLKPKRHRGANYMLEANPILRNLLLRCGGTT